MKSPRLAMFGLAAAAVAYVVLPTGLQVQHAANLRNQPNVVAQETVEPSTLTDAELVAADALLARWSAAPAKPVILTYHDITNTPESDYSVTPKQFESHMAALAKVGAHTMTAQEFVEWKNGSTLPPKSVMITFDDGTRGVWKYADRVLERHSFVATAFVVTGYVGTHVPYYMTWDEIETLHQSGRWSIESHSHLGHGYVKTSAGDTEGTFLGSLQWLDDEGRMETIPEYATRVRTDLNQSVAELSDRGLGNVGLFAFPFSDYGSSAGDDQVTVKLLATAGESFTAVFNDSRTVLPIAGPFQFNRLDIGLPDTTTDLMTRMAEWLELNPA